MRPLRLRIQGLRSYRGSCEIDFTGRDLIAIVGDTGAGKSSILEAITYALFNATTWDAGEVKMLIADQVETMAVELEFWADGRRWVVRRSCSRRGYPPPVHELRCLDDPEFVPLEREAAVTEQVQRLLGLDRRAFLTAAVLPQGRFATLLQERAGERARILKGIFRVTELDEVRGRVDGFRQRAAPLAARLEGERAQLPADPAAETLRLETEVAALQARHRDLAGLIAEVDRLGEAEREADRRTSALREPRERLAGLRSSLPEPPSVVLARLRPLERDLEAECEEVRARLLALQAEVSAFQASQQAAAAACEGPDDLQEAVSALERAASERDRLKEEGARLEEQRRELEAEAQRLEAGRTELERREQEAAAAQREMAAVEQAQREHADRESMVRDALARARRCREEADELAGEEAAKLADLERGRRELGEQERRLREAGEALERAVAAEEEARRAHIAAHLLQGRRPGDPCPVCRQPLPEGLEVETAALEPRIRDREAATQRERSERQKVARALAMVQSIEGELDRVSQRRQRAEEQAAGARRDAERLLPGASLEQPDAELFAPLEAEAARLAAEMAERRAAAQAARSEADRAAAAHAEAARALDRRRGDVSDGAARLRAGYERLGALLARLPAGLAVAGRPLEEALTDARERLMAVRERERAYQAALSELAAAQRQAREADERLQRQVAEPRGRAERQLASLRARLDDCREALGEPLLGPLPEGLGLAELEEAARSQEAAVEAALMAAAESMAAIAAGLESARSHLTGLLAHAGFASSDELQGELEELERRLGAAEAALERARSQVPVVQDLERRLAAATEIRDSLNELHRLLADGQFIRHVIERRQRMLLAVASRILGDMTQQRFGFSEDFQIVDRLTGQPRSTKTLSGGETFLASLALALALVEIAARSGGKLGALFLDEGFGALDASALDEALAALERRAGQGQLVAVVSHVRAVAERIETVLEVRKLPGGSQARWRVGDERERLAGDELEAGLLA
jgi:exonuclease SbcC